MPDEQASNSRSPSWKELQDFITTQTDKDRALIDSWFKLAASVLGVLLIIAGGMIGFFGVKTLTDAKAAAETAAQDAAKAKVKEVLQEPRIQKLVEETAQQLFKSGAFRQAIEGETAAQLKVAIPVEIRRSLPGNIVKELSRLRTPDLAQGFWAAEENDLTRIYRSGWLLRAALKEKLGPCRSFSCRSFRRV